jgi:hypothetical protein
MSIIINLERARQAVANDVAKGSPLELAKQVGNAAIEAITHGVGSEQGKKYMALFCDDANELAHLTVARSTDEDYMPQIRAYVAAEAVCLPDTNTQLTNGVMGRNIEPLANADVPEGTPEPSAIRDAALFQRLQQV